jgi:hypothetical protein
MEVHQLREACKLGTRDRSDDQLATTAKTDELPNLVEELGAERTRTVLRK